ncbi:hypothetical protein [Methanobrevibacter sp.]|uniref:hypothetical protein n=1 Tax=Methanobrevibacter sp. TaxID=66852 RepID=UPI00386829FF
MLYRGKDKIRLRREDESAVEYNDILERGGPLKRSSDFQSKDVFTLALALGYLNDVSYEIGTPDKFLRASTFDEVLPVLLNSIAIEENGGGIDILSNDDPQEIFKPSEEYANAGFEILKQKYIKNEEEFIEELRLKILKMNKDDYILNKLSELDI